MAELTNSAGIDKARAAPRWWRGLRAVLRPAGLISRFVESKEEKPWLKPSFDGA
jgi:hypothetical protein